MDKKDNKINITEVNEVVSLSSKILRLVYILMIVGIVFIGTLLIKEWGILKFIVTLLKVATPFFIGFVIAWLFNPLVCKLEDRGWSRGLACAVVYLGFMTCILIFFGMLIPTIYSQINDLISSLPSIYGHVTEWFNNIFDGMSSNDFVNISEVKNNLFSSLEGFVNDLTTNLPSTIMSLVGSLISGLGTIAVGLVIGIYLLLDFNNAKSFFHKFVPVKYREESDKLLTDIGEQVRKCVNGTLIVACMVFVCDSLGFAIAGLKAPLLFGLLCGITDLIPYIGPYIGGIAAVVVAFSQSPILGVIVLIIVVVVQLVENYVLQPVVMSKSTQLHPVVIIIGLLVFGHFFGIVGMVLSAPILSLIKVVIKFIDDKYDIFKLTKEDKEITE